MQKKVYIINPSGTSLFKKTGNKPKKKRKVSTMATKRRSKRSKASYVRAGKKAARTRARKRRKNPTRHRPVVYKTGRGKKAKLRRAPGYRLGPRRINPRKRRRNPVRLKAMTKSFFSKQRMTNALMLILGIGGAGTLKAMTAKFIPEGAGRDWYQRLFGALAIGLGATVGMQSKNKAIKSAASGMVAFGLYDLIVSNIVGLQAYLPTISAPTAFMGSNYSYGRSTYEDMMGASISSGAVEVVGANISAGELPDIVGDDYDLSDALEMYA